MILEVNGIPYTFFTSAAVDIRLDAFCRTFRFGATNTGEAALPFRGGEAVRVLDGDDVLVTGNIEQVNADYDDTGHSITVSGRDKAGDILDSTLEASGDFVPPLTMKRAVELIVKQLGVDVTVADDVRPAAFDKAGDLLAPEPGQNAFDFLESLGRKRRVFLTTDGEGRIHIIRGSTARSPGALQNILGADDNNVLSASVSYDLTGRYRSYKSLSGLNPLALQAAGVTSVEATVNQKGRAIDSAIRAGRQLTFIPESQLSSGVNSERASWEANVRKARSRVYSAVVQGFRPAPDSPPWQVNTVVDIVDDFAGINGAMLINSVSYNLDETSGSTTTLGLVATNSYTLALDEPQTETLGGGFLG